MSTIDGLVFREVVSVTQIQRRDREQRHPGADGGDRQLPLRARPLARGCRRAASRSSSAARSRCSSNSPPAHVALGIRRRSRRCARAGDVRGAAEAGVDERRGLRGARARRGQPRAGRDALRARGRRAGRDRRARADLRGAAVLPRSVASDRGVQLSPVLAELAQYPFARLDDWKADARARGIELIDFGMGDPREVTPAFIREAMLASVEAVSSYPRATGLPELREAIARWIDAPLRCRRRPGDRDRADARLEGGDLLVRADRARREAARRGSRARVSRLRARRALRAAARS